jgi:F-type H+-transporting ATPase subunit b
VSTILGQLGIDQTFFIQLAIFAVLFFILSQVYFKPFMRLFEARHQKTTADREAAERMMLEAKAKLEEYQRKLAEERAVARKDYDAIIDQAKKEEAALLAAAREEAKKITHQAAESVAAQREKLRTQLEVDVESIALSISEKLLSRRN